MCLFVVGFVVGLLASQLLLYIVLIFFRTPPTRGVISCFIVATILPIGLALSAKVRCIFALVIPTLCSGRYSLIPTLCFGRYLLSPTGRYYFYPNFKCVKRYCFQ